MAEKSEFSIAAKEATPPPVSPPSEPPLPAQLLDIPRAWAKVSIVRGDHRGAPGVTIGCLHADRECDYLKPRLYDKVQSRAVEIHGALLGILKWCRKCAPEHHAGFSVEVPIERVLPGSPRREEVGASGAKELSGAVAPDHPTKEKIDD